MTKKNRIKALEERVQFLEELCDEFYQIIYDVDMEEDEKPPTPDPNAN